MQNQNTYTLVNPSNGNLAFKIFTFESNSFFDHIQRHNYYSLIWVKEGKGKLKADFSEYDFEENCLFAFAPYQPFMISSNQDIKGIALQFHSDFFCIHKHDAEISCNGVLFNNIYNPPRVTINQESAMRLNSLIEQMKAEMLNLAFAQNELLVAYLKIFLIITSRLKTEQAPKAKEAVSDLKEPFILQSLKETIEKEFRTKHSASDYANALNISSSALAKITKAYFNKTITDLISERIIIEAKRELYLTNKPVKEIAFELGYQDEYYFSRFFKNNADISPQMYRDTVGFGKMT